MSTEQITEFLTNFAGCIWSLANTTFATAVIGSLAGAFAGAYGAQRIAERSKTKELLLAEIRNTNAAIMVASVVFSFFYGLKKQHVKSLKDTFDQQIRAFNDSIILSQQGTLSKDKGFEFMADFQSLPPVLTPTTALQTLVFEKISLNGRPLSLAVTLTQVAHSVDELIQKRNHLIESYKVDSSMSQEKMLQKYFGRPDRNGNTDSSYPDSISGIYDHTNDCIFFSKLLYQDLNDHGEELRKKYTKTFGKDAPKINKIDFSEVEKEDFLPDIKNYQNWINGFLKK